MANYGTPPYTYAWSGSVSGSGQSLAFQPQLIGTWTEHLVVTDSTGGSYGPTSCSVSVVPSVSTSSAAKMLTPRLGSVLLGGANTFTWDTGTGVSQYQFLAGSTPGTSDIFSTTSSSTSVTVNLPNPT